MRLYVLLILIAVSMAFSAGFLSLSLRQVPPPNEETISHLEGLGAGFQSAFPPAIQADLTRLFPIGDPAQFVDPELALPQSHRYRRKELARLYRYSKTCAPDPRHSPETPLKKAWTWERYNCGALARLPRGFFDAEPFVHPSGKTFAFLAVQSRGRIPLEGRWVQEHLHLFHVSELARLAGRDERFRGLGAERKLLLGLQQRSLKSIAAGEPVVLSKEHVLFRKPGSGEKPGSHAYAAYLRKEWEEFVRESPFTFTAYAREGQHCLHKEGDLCWDYDVNRVYRAAHAPTLLLLAGSVLLTALVVHALVKRIRAQKSEEERKRFALQTLTHELRTPLASLVVSVEELRLAFDLLPESGQDALMRVYDDVKRLQRLAESSKQYLSAHAVKGSESPGSLIVVEHREVPSINGFVEAILDPFLDRPGEPRGPSGPRLRFEPLEHDVPVRLDPYWVGICVKNLVENALSHGKPPVVVSLRTHGQALEICVQDEGACSIAELSELTLPFVRGTRSQGLGLGLSIVRKVVEEMRGALVLTHTPTRFVIRLAGSRENA